MRTGTAFFQDLPARGVERWRAIAVAALAFTLPLAPAVLPALMAIVIALHLPGILARTNGPRFNIPWRTPLPWAALYLVLHIIGMAWTSNTDFGWFDVGIKLPLLLLPLLAFFPGVRAAGRSSALAAFCLGNAAAVLICVLLAANRAIGPDGAGLLDFLSSQFSAFLHPSYFAWYLSVALAAFLLGGVGDQWPRAIGALYVIVICIGIVLCEGRMSWITLPIMLLWALIHGWPILWKRYLVLSLIVGSLVGGVLLVMTSVNVRERVLELVTAAESEQPHDTTSGAARRIVWRAAKDVGKENLPWGTGTGDVKDELLLRYKEIGATHALEHRLNAHNQFLQSYVALGIPGLLALVLFFVASMRSVIKPGQAFRACFLLLAIMNWSVESMLEVQAGALFTGFMVWLLWWPNDATSSSRP